jgi:type II secretory pathway component GspD/PulD (secretin)
MKTSSPFWLYCNALLAVLCFMSSTIAQPPVVVPNIENIPPEHRARFMEEMKKRGLQPGMMPGQPGQPPGEQKPEGNKDGEKKPDDKKDEGAKSITRPTDKPVVVDPNRVKLTPDKDGRVQFSYMGQPWSDVLQDYADAAKLSFDWQELPADFLNLTTQRKYTLGEARDLLNRHLLARGFTLIQQGEVLSVVKVANLDSSLVPKVEADDLDERMPHEFVRVRFTLPSTMDPAKAAEDVKALLRPDAKITPLLETKRLLVIDTVGNLRNVRDLLYSEQMAESQIIKPKVFQIRYRRADYIADQVMIVLGIDKDKRQSPQEQMMAQQAQMQQMQMQQEMMQRGGGRNGGDMAKMMQKDEPKVFITVDRRQNTILVNAPPDLMPVIDRTIAELDVPEGGEVPGGDGTRYMEKYSTVTAGPDAIVTALQEIGNLHPLTQLQTDAKSKTIYAYATAGDHETIKRMIDKLDGSGRKPEVIWLPKRLPADDVAGSIMALIAGPKEEDENNRFPFFFWGGRRNNNDDQPKTAFRVLPDVENNRLLLWATDNEMAEVKNLIEKLSQRADGTLVGADRVRVLEPRNEEATERLLERLKDAWAGENELEIEIPKAGILSPEAKAEEQTPAGTTEKGDKVTSTVGSRFHLAQLTETADASPKVGDTAEALAVEDKKAKPKVKVTVNDDGQLVIISDDPGAIDQMQELIDQLAPPQPEFKYYRLVYIASGDMKEILETYFLEDLAEDDRNQDWRMRLFSGRNNNEEEPATLGKRRKLRFIDDYYSNTLIVSNASPGQMRVIDRIIKMYDVEMEPKGFDERHTITVKVKYSRAADIAKALKEVYADLLSSKDKEFQGREGQQSSFGAGRSRRYMFGGTGNKDSVLISFEGTLSIGVDEVSNSLVISAHKGVLESIKDTINVLDQAAEPNTVVRVHEVSGMMDPQELRRAVMQAMSEPWVGGKPVSQLNANQNQGQQGQRPEGWRDRGQRGWGGGGGRGRGGDGRGRGGN